MTLIDTLTPTQINDALKGRKVSQREIAAVLDLSQPVISDIINGIYEGNEDTKFRVMNYIESVILDRIDMNMFINKNCELFICMAENSINDKRFTLDQKVEILKFYEDVKKFKQIKS
jgi:predicted transcriptional regulator